MVDPAATSATRFCNLIRVGAATKRKIVPGPDGMTLLMLSDRRDAKMTVPSNQSMKPTAPLGNAFSVFATTPCRGLSLSR
jgi:hypothetical protein